MELEEAKETLEIKKGQERMEVPFDLTLLLLPEAGANRHDEIGLLVQEARARGFACYSH